MNHRAYIQTSVLNDFSFLLFNYSKNNDTQLCKAAKTKSEACESIRDFVENDSVSKEPFTTSFEGANEWHKKAGGDGGCIIL